MKKYGYFIFLQKIFLIYFVDIDRSIACFLSRKNLKIELPPLYKREKKIDRDYKSCKSRSVCFFVLSEYCDPYFCCCCWNC